MNKVKYFVQKVKENKIISEKSGQLVKSILTLAGGILLGVVAVSLYMSGLWTDRIGLGFFTCLVGIVMVYPTLLGVGLGIAASILNTKGIYNEMAGSYKVASQEILALKAQSGEISLASEGSVGDLEMINESGSLEMIKE